jgi:hypothetical protein
MNGSYELHCDAARGVAEAYFDARKVLTSLLECAMKDTIHHPTAAN